MESILKDVKLGLLLRSAFAGVFFNIAYGISRYGDELSLQGIDIVGKEVPIAFFVGMAAYHFHRSLIYPFIEFRLDSRSPPCPVRNTHCQCETASKNHCLIHRKTICRLLYFWRLGTLPGAGEEYTKRMTGWADTIQFLLTSSICIAAGVFTAFICTWNSSLYYSTAMLILAALFAVAAWGSNVRLWQVSFEIINRINVLEPTAKIHSDFKDQNS